MPAVGSSLRRAAGFAAVSLLALTVSLFDGIALIGFALVAITGVLISEGSLFRTFADRAEQRSRRLVGLPKFAAVAALLAGWTVLDVIPAEVFAGVVLLVGFGYLGAETARLLQSDRLMETAGFITVGVLGYALGHTIGGGLDVDSAAIGTLAMAGALVGALLRAVFWARRDGLLLLVLGGFLWGLFMLPFPSAQTVALAIVTSIVLAYLALIIGVASVTGMTTGVLMVFLTIVFGGLAWVTMLVAFFGIGGLATKYRYLEKRARGVAEANRGARGTGNVLGNTIVALGAVLAYAGASGNQTAELVFAFAFAGAIATALSDTLSSEIGSLYDRPMLITSFDRVSPGTDGAVTVPGTLAGAAGAGIVAGIFVLLGPAGAAGGVVILIAGTVGMLVDSFLGAVVEDRLIGNHGVNAAATFAGALLAGLFAIGLVYTG